MEKTYVITGDHKGLSLFHFLKAVLPDLDRKFLRRLVGAGQALVNGTTQDPARPLRVGDLVSLELPEGPAAKRPIEPPRVLYEDAAIIALDKPAGISAIRERDRARDTIVDAYLASLPEASRPRERPRVVHRLDKDTSGVLLLARTREAKVALYEEFVARRVEKSYLALVIGRVPDDEGHIEERIGYQKRQKNRMVVSETGKKAITDYHVKTRYRGYTLVRVLPRTGRTHQIRVHFAYLGFPVLCDKLYGGGETMLLSELKPDYKPRRGEQERPLLSRQALHAHALTFKTPATGEMVTVESPLPKDLLVVLKKLDKYALLGPGGAVTRSWRPW